MLLLAILLVGVAVISFFRPTLAVGLILALLPTYLIRLEIFGYPTTFLELIMLIVIGVIFTRNLNNLYKLKTLGSINIAISLFAIAGIISTFVSPDQTHALGILKAFIIEPILFFYAARLVLTRENDLKWPVRLLFLSAVIISLFGIVQYFTLIHLPMRFWGTGAEVERISSVFDYPNALALYLAPLIGFFTSFWFLNRAAIGKKTLITGLGIMTLALIFTFSRGAWLGLATGLGFLALSRYNFRKVAGLGLMALAILLAIPVTRNRLSLISEDASSSAHVELNKAAFTEIKGSPILGNGLAGFRTTLEKQHFNGEILNYPHNILLNFWVEMGLLGLISFIWIIFLAFSQYQTNPQVLRLGAVVFLIIMAVHGMFDVPYFKNDLSILFWFMLSISYL